MNKLIERSLYWLFPSVRRRAWQKRLDGMMEPGSYYLNGFMGEAVRVLVTDRFANGQQELHVEALVRGKWMRIGKVEEECVPELMHLVAEAYNFLHPGTFQWTVTPR